VSRLISARFTTLCGCVKFESVSAPPPAQIQVPIRFTEHGIDAGPNFNRTFKLRSFNPVDAPVEADYVEVFS
jgi:hypothetical protein